MITQDAQYFAKRFIALKKRRSSYLDTWREVSDHMLPRRSRFLVTDARNPGSQRNNKILNESPTRSLEVLAAGMVTGITSPSRPWFKLTLAEKEIEAEPEVKEWMYEVERRVYDVFARSNIYNCLAEDYRDISAFGTTALLIEEDDVEVIRGYVQPIGSYCIDVNASGKVEVFYREFLMTVEQVVSLFGHDACSSSTKSLYDRGDYAETITVVHAVERNRNLRVDRDDSDGMPFVSVWYEDQNHENRFLRRSGYRQFPVMAPRWTVTGEDVYGSSCPGVNALPACKMLMQIERRAGQIIDKTTSPTLMIPAELRNQAGGADVRLAGGVMYVSQIGAKAEPVYVPPWEAYRQLSEYRAIVERRIGAMFYADLFAMFAQMDNTMTAREVEERHEEKMLQLGPLLEQVHAELLRPLIERTITIMLNRGLLPPIPESLEGREILPKFISILAQAQQLASVLQIERLYRFVGEMAGVVGPQVLDKCDWEGTLEEYARTLGVPPVVLRSEEEMQEIVAQRQQAAQMQQAAEMAKVARDTAAAGKDAAATEVAPNNPYGDLMRRIGAMQ